MENKIIPKKIANSFLVKHAGLSPDEIEKFVFKNCNDCKETMKILMGIKD